MGGTLSKNPLECGGRVRGGGAAVEVRYNILKTKDLSVPASHLCLLLLDVPIFRVTSTFSSLDYWRFVYLTWGTYATKSWGQ